jgi:hypothetical protein
MEEDEKRQVYYPYGRSNYLSHTRLCPVIVGVTVKQNPSYMELPLCWGVPHSAVVKSLSENCLLHKYLLCSILAESAVQDISVSDRNLPGKKWRKHVRPTIPPPSLCRLSRKCGIIDVSQPYRPLWPVTGMVLFYITFCNEGTWSKTHLNVSQVKEVNKILPFVAKCRNKYGYTPSITERMVQNSNRQGFYKIGSLWKSDINISSCISDRRALVMVD